MSLDLRVFKGVKGLRSPSSGAKKFEWLQTILLGGGGCNALSFSVRYPYGCIIFLLAELDEENIV